MLDIQKSCEENDTGNQYSLSLTIKSVLLKFLCACYHPGMLLDYRFEFGRFGCSVRVSLSYKFPGDAMLLCAEREGLTL